MIAFNEFNIALTGAPRDPSYNAPDYFDVIEDGILYRYDNEDWDYCQVISLQKATPGFSYAHACGDSQLPQVRIVMPRPIPVRDAPLRPSDAEEAASYRRAQALTRSKRVYKFSYGQQRLFINGVPCQGPLTRSQARKKRVFSLNKIFERKAAAKEQLRLERFERLWGKSAYSFLKSLGYKKVHIAPYVPFPALPTSCRQVKNTTARSSIDCSLKGTFVGVVQAVRDSGLALKLRELVKSFRPTFPKVPTKSVSLRDLVRSVFIPRVFGQMEEQGAHGAETVVTSEKISNTVITTHNENSIGKSADTVLNWHSLTTTEVEQEYTFGTERWNIYKIVPWKKEHIVGSNLEMIMLPQDLMKQCWNQPSMAVFKNNRYWRSDVEFRFQLNTNKFQSGSLQCSYFYDLNADRSNPYRTSLYSASQTNYCLLDASGSNMGTLTIPYKWNNPYLNTDNDKAYCLAIVKVLNALDCPSSTYGEASLTIYYRFVNAKFMGTLDAGLVVKPQMLTLMRALGAAAEAGLRSVNKDLNRDKPPEPSAPVPFTPRSTSSWCLGTNIVEPTNLLRLDSTGQTPHPNLKLSSMLVSDLVNIYGLIHADVHWTIDQEIGAIIKTIDGAPIFQLDEYAQQAVTWDVYPHANEAYGIPPVGVVSSLFSYWRGTLDLRMDIVGTPFHKGQLLVSYIPRNHLLDELHNKITLEMAKSSNYTICDLSETRSFTIKIPYISSRPMYPIRYSQGKGKVIPPPGYVNIFVLNPLIPMDNVSRYVSINFYIRGGSDFELLVPSQPSLGLPYDPSYQPEPSNISYTTKTQNPSGAVALLPFNYADNVPILYLSTNINAYIGNVITVNFVYDFALKMNQTESWFKTTNFCLRLPTPVKTNLIKDRKYVEFNYCALIERVPNDFVLVPVEKEFISQYSSNNKNKTFTGIITKEEWLAYYKVDGAYQDKNMWAKNNTSIFGNVVYRVRRSQMLLPWWAMSEPQMEERVADVETIVSTSGALTSTGSGLITLGENFNDLKTMCRRFQKLFNYKVTLDNTKTDKLSIFFPVSPMGIINNSSSSDNTVPEIFNRCRDGVIPIVCSGYRFWRGSLRYRIMTNEKVDLNMIVQHRPDITTTPYGVSVVTDDADRNSYLNHGYSMVIQNLSINNCVDIEVPWYNPNMLASCHHQNTYEDINFKYSLGTLFIGFNNSSTIKDVGLSVYYSIGDDFRFDTFQGFPMMLSVNHVAVAQPQMFETLKGWMSLPKEIKKANDTASNFQDNVLPKIQETLKSEFTEKMINVYEVLCDVASQLVHIAINPNLKTILWSIFTVFVKFGLLTIKCASKLVSLGLKLLDFATTTTSLPFKAPFFLNRFRYVNKRVYYRGVRLPQFCPESVQLTVRLMIHIDKIKNDRFAETSKYVMSNQYEEELTEMLLFEGFAGLILGLDQFGTREEAEVKLLHRKFPIHQFFDMSSYKSALFSGPEWQVKFDGSLAKDLKKSYEEACTGQFLDIPPAKSSPSTSYQSGDSTQASEAEEIAASMVSVIYSSVCVLLSYTCNSNRGYREFIPVLLKGMGTTASGANNIFRFIKNNFKLFNIIYEKIMYNKYWTLRNYKIIETENDSLNKWANAVSVLLQPKFRTFVDNKQLWRDAVFGAARFGFLYLNSNACSKGKNTSVDPFIRKLYDSIVRLRDELQTQKLFPSLRQEAFSMWIYGPAGVGKSTLVDELTTRMLKAIDFTHVNELKYTISPVTKHWDGCNQQPVVVIDDAFAVDEPEANASQLWAYFQICSPIPLRPPMAKLDEKSMTYNPEIFVSCANMGFPKISMLRTEEALFRRRHLLIETRLSPKTKSADYPFGLTAAQVKNYEHIQFRIALDPRNRQTKFMAWLDFEQFVGVCICKFKEFKVKSKATYEARHELHYSLYPKDHDVPEEASLKELYSADNASRTASLAETVDTFGITTKDTLTNLKEIGETIKEIPSDPSNPVHPSLKQQAVDLALKSMEECLEPLQLKDLLAITQPKETRVEGQMDDIPTLTEHIGLRGRQTKICTDVVNRDHRMKMIKEVENIIEDKPIADPNDEILLGTSKDFKAFEAALDTKFGQFFNIDDNIRENFVVMDADKFKEAPYVNSSLESTPLLSTILNNNCLHKLIDRDSPIIKTDNNKYLFWLVHYEDHAFAVYDTPCRSPSCVLKMPEDSVEFTRFCSYIYAWYSKNYDFLQRTYTRFAKMGGVNFLFIENFNFKQRFALALRNVVVSAINRYTELGLWKGYILPSAHWLGGWLAKIYGTLQTILGVCGMLSIGYFSFRMWSPAFGPNNHAQTHKPRSKPQLISSGDSGTHNRPNNTRFIVSKKLQAKQQLNDHCLSSVIRKRIHANTIYIEFTDNTTLRQAVMKCLIVKGRTLLVIKHYYDYLSTYTSENSDCYLCWNDVGRVPFDFKSFEWTWFEDSNFGVIELPRTVSERKSLIQFMATEHQANTNVSPDCEIIDCNLEAMKIFNERVAYCGTVVIEPNSYSEEMVMNGCWRYGRNYPGMCGSVLLSKNLSNPILGMHVAGGKGFGYSEPLTREMFSSLEGKLDGPINEYRELDIPIVPLEDRKVYLTGTHRYAGNIDADLQEGDIKLAKAESGITKIVPSLLHGVYPILTEPGPLTPKDPRLSPKFSPLVEGCEKMCNPTFEFDALDVSASEDDLLQKLLSCVKPLRMNVDHLSLEQALNGIPDLPGYDHINWDTSEGFPLSRIRPTGARNKRWLFNFNEQGRAVGIHDALISIMEQKMKDRENGIVPVTLHDDCLKDARIPKEKVNVPGKTRIFSISPVDFTIQFRQYYLDFIAAYGEARFKAEHAIGINVHGLEWTDLANLVGSDHMITGDYSGFGPTLNTEVLHAAFRIIFKWYQHNGGSDHDHRIRYVMSREIANARHLMRDYVYQTSCGMPSGNPGTVIFNSLVNSIYIRCAYLKLMRRTLYSGLYCFNKYVTLVTYGDDLIAKLHPKIIEGFNFNTLSGFFLAQNIKFTDAAKTGIAVEPTITLSTATFLKHCFNPHPTRKGLYLAGLDKVSITECVNWVKSSPDMKDATYQNCNQATMLAYGWGPEYFGDIVNTIRDAWRQKFDEPFRCRTWEELDVLFLDENWDPNLKW